jgi:D-alanyl-D-alanine carboxypeptidase
VATRTRTRLTPFGKAVVVVLAAAAVLGLIRWGLAGTGVEPVAKGGPAAGSSSLPLPRTSGSPLPQCIYGDIAADHTGYDQWNRTLLDTSLRIPKTYVPPDLVPVSEAGFARDLRIRSLAIVDLAALRQAAAKAGHPVDVVATYRSYNEQAQLFDQRKQQFGYDRSLDKTARAGHSEHQLGTVVDFKTFGASDVTQSWGSEPAGRWMAQNAYRYGFILSYPNSERDRTCYPYEPWHFRYLGRAMAADVHRSGLTLREYLWRLNHP